MGGLCGSKTKSKDKNSTKANNNDTKNKYREQNQERLNNLNNINNINNNNNNITNNARINQNQAKEIVSPNYQVQNNLVVLSHRSRPQISQRDLNPNANSIPRRTSSHTNSINSPNFQTFNNFASSNNIITNTENRINIPGENFSSRQPENANNSINEEFTSRRNQMSVTNQLNLYPSSNGVVLRNVFEGSIEQSQLCSLCNRSFWNNAEFRDHLPWCTGARNQMVHSSLNDILNLVQSLNRQLHGEVPLNILTLLGMEEPEENLEYIDWEYSHSSDGTVVWKNCGKVKLTKEELSKITNKNVVRIKEDKYYAKRIWMTKYINKNFYDKSGSNTTLVVSRDNILEESFNQFMTTHELDLKRAMHIFFVDEVAHDVGGVYREWYTNLFDVIFSKDKGFFYENTEAGPGKNSYFIPRKTPNEYTSNFLDYYEFIGKVLGKAIFDKITLKTNFNLVLLKHLMHLGISIEDIRYIDNEFYCNLRALIDSPLDDNSGLFFTWNIRNDKDELEEVELIPNGKNIMLTEENKLLFVIKVVNYLCYESVKQKIDSFVKGFYSIMSYDIVKIFSLEEFDFLISGQNQIDINDWRANTIYKGMYSESHKTIKIFWAVLADLSSDKLLKFYKFCTGCNRVPIDGFNSLQGTRNKYQKFCIESPAFSDEMIKKRLIEANTCFNRIYLPPYENEDEMRKVISTIIDNDTNFFGKQ